MDGWCKVVLFGRYSVYMHKSAEVWNESKKDWGLEDNPA